MQVTLTLNPEDAIRCLNFLKGSASPLETKPPVVEGYWESEDKTRIPEGTVFTRTYDGVDYEAIIDQCRLMAGRVGGPHKQYFSLSEAATTTGKGYNGWFFWRTIINGKSEPADYFRKNKVI